VRGEQVGAESIPTSAAPLSRTAVDFANGAAENVGATQAENSPKN
jgi:hypothetical protein